VERTWGDVGSKAKYSHFDLIHMIGGVDTERGATTSGGLQQIQFSKINQIGFDVQGADTI
jgi:hypothetical protein